MNKKQNIQREVTFPAPDYGFNNNRLKEKSISLKGTSVESDSRKIRLTEVITPHPYSVFALRKICEQFQRN